MNKHMMESNQPERITQVDRSSGVISLFRVVPTKGGKPIYSEPSKNIIPDDGILTSSIDAAYDYVMLSEGYKDAVNEDWLKATFAGGIFVGMSLLYILELSIGMF